MRRIVGLAELAVKTAAEREKLAEAVDSTMNKIAPNITQVAGATIGARLIAKAGGLDRMARLPASTIQVLGAEKALFRAHQDGLQAAEARHTVPARGGAHGAKVAEGEDREDPREQDRHRRAHRLLPRREGGGADGPLEKRLKEIRIKYKEPSEPPRPEQRREFRQMTGNVLVMEARAERKAGGRQDKRFYKEPGPRQ